MSEKTETELSNADKVRRVSQELNPANLDLSGIDYVASTIKRKRRQTGVLRYPLESLTEHTDYLQIDIEQYVALGGYTSNPGDENRYVTGNYFTTDRAGRRSSNRLSKKPLINAGSILLPIPSNVADTNNVQYDSSNLNGLGAVGLEAADDIMNVNLDRLSYTPLHT